MNPAVLFLPSKGMVRLIVAVFAVLIVLPAIAVFATATSGIQAASNTLAFINPLSHLIEVHDPSGNLITTLTASTTWPVRGKVTTEFGAPDPPYQAHHTGTDISEAAADPITTFMDGKVLIVQDSPNNPTGFGKYVYVDHGNGITSYYGHMSETSTMVGQDVKPGDIIGYEGNTGHSLGNHVHFEVRVYNIPVEPRTFVAGDPTP
jgi:murein DD-endopeptidase MepM/ murein hydrolase activator NlpD